MEFKMYKIRLGVVTHTCNSSYLGGRDQEDSGSKPCRQNISKIPISTNKLTVGHMPATPTIW
jgi:hypothetical protein